MVLRLTLAPPAVCSITRVSGNVRGYSWLLTDPLGVPAGNQKPASNPTDWQSPQFGNSVRFKQLCRFLWFHLSALGLDALQPEDVFTLLIGTVWYGDRSPDFAHNILIGLSHLLY